MDSRKFIRTYQTDTFEMVSPIFFTSIFKTSQNCIGGLAKNEELTKTRVPFVWQVPSQAFRARSGSASRGLPRSGLATHCFPFPRCHRHCRRSSLTDLTVLIKQKIEIMLQFHQYTHARKRTIQSTFEQHTLELCAQILGYHQH